jgi:PAS domain S-box-containing protein
LDPSDHDQNELGNGATGGDNRPAHAKLTPSEDDAWLRSVVENSSEIVTIVDPDGTLRYANPAWERTLGYDPDGAIGKMNVLDHVHPEDLGHVLEETEGALAEGGSQPTRPSTAFVTRTARGCGWRAWAPTCWTTLR